LLFYDSKLTKFLSVKIQFKYSIKMLLFDLRSNEKKFQKVESLAYIFAADSVGLSSIFIQIFVAG